MDDKFSVAFEFYINVGHAVVERVGVSQAFSDLVWKQVQSKARGETSLDAWESRKLATEAGPDAEKYKNEYFAASFSDAISIYLLSLFIDVDYYDLRERDYPLLAPAQMAERLKKVAELFPANPDLTSRFTTREGRKIQPRIYTDLTDETPSAPGLCVLHVLCG